MDVKHYVEITLLDEIVSQGNSTIIVAANTLTLNHLDTAWRLDLVHRNEQSPSIQGGHFDWLALDGVIKRQLMFVNEAILFHALEQTSI